MPPWPVGPAGIRTHGFSCLPTRRRLRKTPRGTAEKASPGARLVVTVRLSAYFDRDLPRLGLRNLRQSDLEHAVLVHGLDRAGIDRLREGEAAGESAKSPFQAVRLKADGIDHGGLASMGEYSFDNLPIGTVNA